MNLAELDIAELKAIYRSLGDIINDLSYLRHLQRIDPTDTFRKARVESLSDSFDEFMDNLEKFLERIVE